MSSPSGQGVRDGLDSLADACRRTIDDARILRVRYSPLLRNPFYRQLTPQSAESADRQTVVYVESTEEISSLMKAAYERCTPIYVRQGSGHVSVDLRSTFPPGAVVLDLRRMKEFRLDERNNLLQVGPSVTLTETNERLRACGIEYPESVGAASWGSLVSTNTSGHMVDAYDGKPGDLVLGLTVVLPNGEILRTGSSSLRKVAGPDLTRLFIGGQCLFGVITEIRLRVRRRPAAASFGWCTFEDLTSLAAGICELYTSGAPPISACEFVGRRFCELSGLDKLTASGELVLIATTGDCSEDADRRMSRLLATLRRHGVRNSSALSDDAAWRRIWALRRDASHNVGDYTFLVGEAIDVRLTKLGEALVAVAKLREAVEEEFHEIRGYLWGHIGSSSIHPVYVCRRNMPYGEMARAARAIRERVRALRLSLDGTVGEQGIYPEHLEWLREADGGRTDRYILAIKRAFDDRNILNPARVEPNAAPCGWGS